MDSSYSKQFTAKSIFLFIVWLVLSGRYDLPHVVLGFMLSCGVAWLNTGYPNSPFHHFPWGRIMLYIPWLLLRIIESSWHLTKLILNPALPIEPKFLTYKSHLKEQVAVVLLGNTITLTPGTITVELNGNQFLVHAIDTTSGAELTSGRMERKIAVVFQEQKSRI